MARYRASERTAHGCCYGASVEDTNRPSMVAGKHYNGEYDMVCECSDMETANRIAEALNHVTV